jgi:hypothetical protein
MRLPEEAQGTVYYEHLNRTFLEDADPFRICNARDNLDFGVRRLPSRR